MPTTYGLHALPVVADSLVNTDRNTDIQAVSRTLLDVCLVVVSESASLTDLSARIGVESSDGSHNQGDPHLLKSRGVWKSTVWQCCSELPRATPVEEQFEAIGRRFPSARLRTPEVLPLLSRCYVSIGVFSDAQTPTVDLTGRCLAIAAAYGASVEMSFYGLED